MRLNMMILMCFAVSLSVSSCEKVGSELGGDKEVAVMDIAASSITYTLPGFIKITLINSPALPDHSEFPMTSSDNLSEPVPRNYMTADSEVTFKLYTSVSTWANGSGLNYNLTNTGFRGAVYSASTTTTDTHPVTGILWTDAIVWCNALTEYINSCNGSDPDLDCVYYSDPGYTLPIRDPSYTVPVSSDAGTIFRPYIKSQKPGNTDITLCTARGFRLPTSVEWEFAARYRGNDSENSFFYEGVYYTNGDSPSGSPASFLDEDNAGLFAVFKLSFSDAVSTQPVKSKSSNRMGLYDMSGNVAEWCFDEKMTSNNVLAHIVRGGSWKSTAFYLQTGSFSLATYNWTDSSYGFRVVRNTN